MQTSQCREILTPSVRKYLPCLTCFYFWLSCRLFSGMLKVADGEFNQTLASRSRYFQGEVSQVVSTEGRTRMRDWECRRVCVSVRAPTVTDTHYSSYRYALRARQLHHTLCISLLSFIALAYIRSREIYYNFYNKQYY